MWKEEACLAKVATSLTLLHSITWFSQRKVAPLLTCEECEAQTCNLILNLNFLALSAGSHCHWRKYTSTTSQISSDWAARWEAEGQRVHSKSTTHVMEASGGPKDSRPQYCLSVSHCISISFTGEQDLQPILKWHFVHTLADNTQYHLVMEECARSSSSGQGWSCAGDNVGGCPDIQALATLSLPWVQPWPQRWGRTTTIPGPPSLHTHGGPALAPPDSYYTGLNFKLVLCLIFLPDVLDLPPSNLNRSNSFSLSLTNSIQHQGFKGLYFAIVICIDWLDWSHGTTSIIVLLSVWHAATSLNHIWHFNEETQES